MSDESRRAAGILAQCKWLKDQIKKWEDDAKKTISLEADGGERMRAVLPDGTPIGTVSMVEGPKTMQIDNEEGFLMWVKHRYPHEVVETVRPAFIKLCSEKVKNMGALVDANGEVCPHVSLAQGDPYPKANLSKDADGLMQHMIAVRSHWWDTITKQPELPALEQDCGLGEVYDGPIPMDDVILPAADYPPVAESNDSPRQDISAEEDIEPEPYIEEGPPHWEDSNSFETSDAVRKRRG